MKKILLSVMITLSLIACKKKHEMPNNTSAEKNEVKTVKEDSNTEKKTQIDFDDYQTEFKETIKKAKIDFNSNPNAKAFKTAISDAYKEGVVNFSGNYLIATWGCGTACISGAMVDVRDGKVYDLPSDKEWDGIGNSYDSNKASSLLITSISGVSFGGDIVAIEKYWKWNENAKKFKLIQTLEIKDKNRNKPNG